MPTPDPEQDREHDRANRSSYPYNKGRDDENLGRAFADPNSLDDQKLGNAFVDSNSSRKKHHHLPHLPKKPASTRILWFFILGVIVIFLIVFLIGFLPRHSRNKEIDARAQQQRDALPVVEVETVHRAPDTGGLTIPGTTTPYLEANVYARSSGYISKRLVDLGDHVHKGQLLAVVDSPDLDQQVLQAKQQVDQAVAQRDQQNSQLALTKVTVERWRVLVAKGVVSRQDGDQRETDYRAQLANLAAADRNVAAYQANLQRTIALQQYERVTAPFDGVITARNFDIGALVSAAGTAQSAGAGSAQPQTTGSTSAYVNTSGTTGVAPTAATPATGNAQGGALFTLADVQRLRIFVAVPEGYAASIAKGQHVSIHMQEQPSAVFSGQVTRTAGAIDQNTRTLLVEVQVDNADNKLTSGMYAVATFDAVPSPGAGHASGSILIPGDAIVIRQDKSSVAVIKDGKVHMQPVVIGRDYGTSTEILGGLNEGDLLAISITDDVREGAPVQVKNSTAPGLNPNPQAGSNQSAPPGGSSQYGNQAITDANMQGQQAKQQQTKGSSQQQKSGGQQKDKSDTNSSGSHP